MQNNQPKSQNTRTINLSNHHLIKYEAITTTMHDYAATNPDRFQLVTSGGSAKSSPAVSSSSSTSTASNKTNEESKKSNSPESNKRDNNSSKKSSPDKEVCDRSTLSLSFVLLLFLSSLLIKTLHTNIILTLSSTHTFHTQQFALI